MCVGAGGGSQLLPGDFHWVIKLLHLLVGIAALGLADRLAAEIKRARLPATQVTA
jgi:hypothetical protein